MCYVSQRIQRSENILQCDYCKIHHKEAPCRHTNWFHYTVGMGFLSNAMILLLRRKRLWRIWLSSVSPVSSQCPAGIRTCAPALRAQHGQAEPTPPSPALPHNQHPKPPFSVLQPSHLEIRNKANWSMIYNATLPNYYIKIFKANRTNLIANCCMTDCRLVIKACRIRKGIVLAHFSRDNSEL